MSWDLISLLVTILFGGGIITFVAERVLRRVDNNRLVLQSMRDLYRHSWRNTVILEAVKVMLHRPENQGKRPSEIHLAKLKGLDYDSNVMFNVSTFGGIRKYSYFHELQLKIRNFHTEVDVAIKFLTSKQYDEAYFEDYLDALIWKQSYLISEISRITKLIFPRQNIEDSYAYMMKNQHGDPKEEPNVYDRYSSKMIADIQAELGSTEPIELTRSSKKIFFVPQRIKEQ